MSVISDAIEKASARADSAVATANAAIEGLASAASGAASTITSSATPSQGSAGGTGVGAPLKIGTYETAAFGDFSKKPSFTSFDPKASALEAIVSDLKKTHDEIVKAREAASTLVVDDQHSFGISSFAAPDKVTPDALAAGRALQAVNLQTETDAYNAFMAGLAQIESANAILDGLLNALPPLEDAYASAFASSKADYVKTGVVNAGLELETNVAFKALQSKKLEVVEKTKSIDTLTQQVHRLKKTWVESKKSQSNSIKAARIGGIDISAVDYDVEISTAALPSELPEVPVFNGIRAVRTTVAGGVEVTPGYKFYSVSPHSVDPYEVPAYEHVSPITFDFGSLDSYFAWASEDLPPLPFMDFHLADSVPHFEYTEFADTKVEALREWVQDVVKRGSLFTEGWADASFEAARDKEAGVYTDLVMGIQREFANRGFRVPQPAALRMAQIGAEKYAAAVGEASRAINIQYLQIESELQKFAVEKVLSIETLIADISKSVADRALKAAELTFNLQIAGLNVRMELLKLEISTLAEYENIQRMRLEANLSRLEVVKTSLAVSEFKLKDAQLAREVIRVAQASAGLLIEEHKSLMAEKQLELAYTSAQLEHDRVNLQRYTAIAEVEARKVANTTAVNQSRVAAFSAESDALLKLATARATDAQTEQTRVQAHIAQVKAEMEEYRDQMTVNLLELSAYNEETKALVSQVDAATNRVNVSVPLATTGATDITQRIGDQLQSFTAIEGLKVEAGKIDAEKAIAQARIQVDAAGAAAPVAASMAQAALSAVGAFVSARDV